MDMLKSNGTEMGLDVWVGTETEVGLDVWVGKIDPEFKNIRPTIRTISTVATPIFLAARFC
jgi:hypothetical protein